MPVNEPYQALGTLTPPRELGTSPPSRTLTGSPCFARYMSQCEVFHLKPVFELEQHQVREVLRILLHTVIFNRALGPVKPVERDSELFEVTWVRQEIPLSRQGAVGGAGASGHRCLPRHSRPACCPGCPPSLQHSMLAAGRRSPEHGIMKGL